jgi:hypothetical protein
MKINGGEKSRDTVPLKLQYSHAILALTFFFCLESNNHIGLSRSQFLTSLPALVFIVPYRSEQAPLSSSRNQHHKLITFGFLFCLRTFTLTGPPTLNFHAE